MRCSSKPPRGLVDDRYGEQLNDKPGGPKPYATISEPIADEALRYRFAQDPGQFADTFGDAASGFAEDVQTAFEADNQAGGETPPDPSNGQCPNGSKTIQMEVTAYTNGPESTGKRPGDPGMELRRAAQRRAPERLPLQ